MSVRSSHKLQIILQMLCNKDFIGVYFEILPSLILLSS